MFLSIVPFLYSNLQAHGGGAIPGLALWTTERFVAVTSEPLVDLPKTPSSIVLGCDRSVARCEGKKLCYTDYISPHSKGGGKSLTFKNCSRFSWNLAQTHAKPLRF
jgi:hypothetical protein